MASQQPQQPQNSPPSPPQRQIRAQYTETTITVYQAYNQTIATAATAHQRLNASPAFLTTRMTWIKPSWAWMLYRSGYSYKDPRQERILALHLTHSTFISLLRKAVLSHESGKKEGCVRVQWDPERSVRLEKLGYRSIQIGIPGELLEEFMGGIVRIEDVTGRARELKRVLDREEGDAMDVVDLLPDERVFEVPLDVRELLGMDDGEGNVRQE